MRAVENCSQAIARGGARLHGGRRKRVRKESIKLQICKRKKENKLPLNQVNMKGPNMGHRIWQVYEQLRTVITHLPYKCFSPHVLIGPPANTLLQTLELWWAFQARELTKLNFGVHCTHRFYCSTFQRVTCSTSLFCQAALANNSSQMVYCLIASSKRNWRITLCISAGALSEARWRARAHLQ